LSDLVHGLYAAQTKGEVAAAAVEAFQQGLGITFASCEEITPAGYQLHGMTTHVVLPLETPAYLHDHPMMPSLRRMPAVTHVRGRFSRAAFERTDYFNGVARPMGYNDHIILLGAQAPSTVTFSVCRDDFRPDETQLLTLLQPHLRAAWQRVAGEPPTGARTDLEPLRLRADLLPVGMTPAQARLVHSYFPSWRATCALPEQMELWVGETRRQLDRGVLGLPPRVLSVAGPRGVLLMRYFPLGGGGAGIHLVERLGWHPHAPARFSLSLREREVLRWLALGKRDAEIGLILGLAARTVSKHVEHVLTKLRVPNRTAAAAVLR
jgi:DNA-binding CsgD family transcriptional regulator